MHKCMLFSTHISYNLSKEEILLCVLLYIYFKESNLIQLFFTPNNFNIILNHDYNNFFLQNVLSMFLFKKVVLKLSFSLDVFVEFINSTLCE